MFQSSPDSSTTPKPWLMGSVPPSPPDELYHAMPLGEKLTASSVASGMMQVYENEA